MTLSRQPFVEKSQYKPSQTYNETELFKHVRRKQWLAGLPAHVSYDIPDCIPSILAVGGGKGGVGKSVVSANMAAKLGQAGYKVLLVDLDIGSANLHTYFGISLPEKTLADFVLYGESDFKNIMCATPAEGVVLIPGGRDESWSDLVDFGVGAFNQLWDSFLNAKKVYGFDFVILDLGAGTHRHTIDFFTAAHLGVVTVLPEPTAIENAYSFLKATLWRIIENSGMQCNACAASDKVKEELFSENKNKKRLSFVQKLEGLRSEYPELVHHIYHALAGRQIGFVVNQIRSQRDIDIGASMGTISNNYFGFQTHPMGYLNYDDAAWKSLRNRRLLVLDFPHSLLSRRLNEVTRKALTTLGYP